ncbi:gustatory and pheromone receptor 39a-like [Saccostrea echinata]|uniref:gustatory and pheromone receptor 39a-like n=1 Tax=Saccostrea echinata TaxID=191078 RepID=UPI002A81C04B|nr:gustatory and pheromone receptor 39a-like [Saccostrea echinata]
MPTIVVPVMEDKRNSLRSAWTFEEDRGLKWSFRSLLWVLKLAGLLHGVKTKETKSDEGHENEESPTTKSKRKCSFWLVYDIVVFLILLGNFGSSLATFKNATSLDGMVCNEIITCTWFLQAACYALNNIIGCRNWNAFFEKWDALSRSLGFKHLKTPRRISIATCILYTCWLLASFGFMGIGMYFISSSGPPPPQDAASIIIKIVQMIIYYYFVSVWFLLTAMFVIACYIIYIAFRHFKKKFVGTITSDGKFNGDIENFRLQHMKLLDMLYTADDIFSMYVLVTIATIIPLIIFTLYFVLFKTVNTFAYAATWWSVGLSFIQIICVFMAGGVVNHEAHAVLSSIYTIDLRNMSPGESVQMTTFLTQLTSNPIGFTAFGLFTIDKPTIITFAGSIVTYAVVVIQFKPSGNTLDLINQALNCTTP